MNFKQNLFALSTLFYSAISLACPNGQFEQCVLPRPWGGCAQSACIPNGGVITDTVSDGLADLNQGVIHLGNGVINTTRGVGGSVAN
ncbi:MAG: hypothetical protein NTX25_24255, partial [Proteobacteria bacterium]|nr:hypothetical protein [Pseudomonadota bacterium]